MANARKTLVIVKYSIFIVVVWIRLSFIMNELHKYPKNISTACGLAHVANLLDYQSSSESGSYCAESNGAGSACICSDFVTEADPEVGGGGAGGGPVWTPNALNG